MKMDIKHLQYFEKALIEWDKLYAYEPLQSKPLDISQIMVIEKALYKTESKTLPDVLRELLLLSGGYCPFFETGIHPTKKNTLDINDLLEDQNYNPYFRFLSRNDAAAVSDLKAIDLLVKHGANLYAQNEKILLVSAKFGDPIFLRDLIDKYEFSQISKNKALVIACSIGIRTSTLYLIRSGAEVNAYNSLCLQIALRNHHFDLATELAIDFEANKRVNSGFLLLFKEEIEQQVTHKYSKKMLFDNVSLLDSVATFIYKQRIINKHYSDLRNFYGNESVVLDKFPSKTNIEIDK